MKVDGKPRYVKWQKCDNRGRLLCEDILDLLTFIDERTLIDNLSMYAAVNLERIPDLKPEELELVCISRKLDELVKRITSVEASSCAEVIMCKLDDVCTQLAQLSAQRPLLEVNIGPYANVQTPRAEEQCSTTADSDKATNHSTSAQALWSDVAVEGVESGVVPQTWQTVTQTKSV